MPHLNELKTRAELGTRCARQDPRPCTREAEFVVRLAIRNPDLGLYHVDTLACREHLFAQRAADPASIVQVARFTGPASDWSHGIDPPFVPLAEKRKR